MYSLLIVDDEEIITDSLYKHFTKQLPDKLDVKKAYSGSEAAGWISGSRIDIVLSDIAMPGMSGFDFVEQVHSYWPRCKVVFLTGYNEFDYVYRAIQMPNVRYLLKTEGYAKVTHTVLELIEQLDHERSRRVPDVEVAAAIRRKEEKDKEAGVIEQICQYIGQHLEDDLSLARLAHLYHFNPSYLSRLFKQEYGMKLSEYIDNCRIDKAMELLRTSELKIREVGDAVGYNAPHSFTRFFKKVTGMSPQEYRDAMLPAQVIGRK